MRPFAVISFIILVTALAPAADPAPTRQFSVKDDRALLDGKPMKLWGIRCGNALYDGTVVERHVNTLNNMAAHGINCVGVYIQGSNGGYPDPEAGLNGSPAPGRSSRRWRSGWSCSSARRTSGAWW